MKYLLVALLIGCASEAAERELPAECLPRADEPPPADDDVRPDDVIDGLPVTVLWLRLATDADCTPTELTSGPSDQRVAWQRDGVTHRRTLRATRTTTISRDGERCRVATTIELLPDFSDNDGLRNDLDLDVGLCGTAILHEHWASLQTARVELFGFAVGRVADADLWLPTQHAIPWAASRQMGCDTPVSARVAGARLRFRTILTIDLDDWLRVQSSRLPVPIAWITLTTP